MLWGSHLAPAIPTLMHTLKRQMWEYRDIGWKQHMCEADNWHWRRGSHLTASQQVSKRWGNSWYCGDESWRWQVSHGEVVGRGFPEFWCHRVEGLGTKMTLECLRLPILILHVAHNLKQSFLNSWAVVLFLFGFFLEKTALNKAKINSCWWLKTHKPPDFNWEQATLPQAVSFEEKITNWAAKTSISCSNHFVIILDSVQFLNVKPL